tara:strand:+ start:802304 stop:804799 length:2496 start_codon:yes stop_codon:yes gene_type:complete
MTNSPQAVLLQQWLAFDTDVSLAHSGIDSFVRMQENHRIRPSLMRIISSEQAILAMRESTRSLRKAPVHVRVDPDAIALDPIIDSMHVAKGDVAEAYRKLHESRETLLLSQQSSDRLAWDTAQMSALPGLIRLVALDVDELMSPVYVRQMDMDEPANDDSKQLPQFDPTELAQSGTSSTSEPVAAGDFAKINVGKHGTGKRLAEPIADATIVKAQPNIVNATDVPPTLAKPILPTHTRRPTPKSTELTEVPAESSATETLSMALGRSQEHTANPSAVQRATPSMNTSVANAPVPSSLVNTAPVDTMPDNTKLVDTLPDDTMLVDTLPVDTMPVDVAPLDKQPAAPVHVQSAPVQTPRVEATPVQMVAVEDTVVDDVAIISSPVEHVAANWPFVGAAESDTESVSLNVNNADVRTVFEMLARGYKMNILVSPDVTGTISANIQGLTATETLNGVLRMCKLKARTEEGLIYIYPGDGLPNESREVRLFPLDFARADALDPAVQGLLSPIGNAYVTQMSADDNLRTNETIVVVDTPEAIAQIEDYILQADRPPRQVMIEAHVLEVELSDDMMHGINIEAFISGDLTVGSFGLADSIASPSNPLIFAEIDGSRVDALIDAIETTTDSKTLASPRVMVVNGQNARIQVGQQLGFTVATVTETATIQDIKFLDTGVVLQVTPTISRDNQVMMQVKPEVSDGQINPDTLLPEEETREVETSVLLDNHQGVVIGGLIQETDRTVIHKLPWLGDVKHVGKLFQRRELRRRRSEIIVTLIPHIIECGPATERDVIDYERATSPLLHGPLKRACRPWDSRLPDTVGQERHLDVNRVNRAIGR